ncbi:hypothetical protein ACFQ0N_12535 [Paenibacillus sp. GCM10027626]
MIVADRTTFWDSSPESASIVAFCATMRRHYATVPSAAARHMKKDHPLAATYALSEDGLHRFTVFQTRT